MEEILLKLEQKISAKSDELQKAIDRSNEMARNASEKSEQVSIDLKNEVKGKLDEFNKLLNEKQKAVEAQQKHLEDLEAKMNRKETEGRKAYKGLYGQLQEELSNSEKFKNYLLTKKGMPDIDIKVVGNMTQGANLTNTVIPPTVVPGIIEIVENSNHIRTLLPVASTSSNQVWYIKETGSEGTVATVAEGNTKPQLDYDMQQDSTPVKKIAAHVRISEEMLADIPALSGFITQRTTQKLMIVEDAQLLYGTGLTTNLTGLTVNAEAFNPGYTVEAAQMWDVLAAAIGQLATAYYSASAIVMHPTDFYKMSLLKDTQERYLAPIIWQNNRPTVYGIPIVLNTAITLGDFLVGDFRMGAQIYQREGLSVRFYDQDQDNAIKNLVTVVIEERLALPIFRDDVFIYDTFATVLGSAFGT